MLPVIAALLAERKPWLHVSFHPFDPVAYTTALLRLCAGRQAAEALAPHRFMHLYAGGAWHSFGTAERMDFLRQYLLRTTPLPRIATPRYGFADAVAFSDDPIDLA